jgi:hypothetical protein
MNKLFNETGPFANQEGEARAGVRTTGAALGLKEAQVACAARTALRPANRT